MSVVVIDNGNDAAQAIGLFPRNYKLISWLAIHTLGLPTVDGVIFDTWGEHVAKAIHRFCGLIGTDRLLLRSDKADEAGTSPRGGFLVDIQNVHEEVLPLIEQGRTLFLLEPKSPFSDLYSVGVLAWPGDRCMVIEVVGPGFDASDLKARGPNPPRTV